MHDLQNQQRHGNDTDRLTESTQRSSDEIRTTSGEAIPPRVQLGQESRHFDFLIPPRLSESTIAPFEGSVVEQRERIQQHFQQEHPGVLDQLAETPQSATARHEISEQSHASKARGMMAMMERQIRIAERQGAFDDAKRKKLFKETYSHRCNQRQRSQASVKLKARVEEEQNKVDARFWRSSQEEEEEESPKDDAWNRFRRWSHARVGIAGEDRRRSVGDESGYASDDESPSPRTEMREEPRREEAAEAVRYAGTALRSGPFIF